MRNKGRTQKRGNYGVAISAVSAVASGEASCNRGGKLCISDGGSLWAGKSAVLLRLHQSRQVASCLRDPPQLGCGEMSVSVSPRVLRMNKNGCSMNKIGYFMKSKHRYWRCYLPVTIMSLLDNTRKSSGIHCDLFVQQTAIISLLDVVYRCGI